MNSKSKIKAAMSILGEEKLGEVLGWFGYFGEPSEALVWKAINQTGEPFVKALDKEAKKCASRFGGQVVNAPKVSRIDGDGTKTTDTPTVTTTSDTSGSGSNAKSWIDSAFGWLKSGSDIAIDWAKLYKDNPGAYTDAAGNLYSENGTLLAMAGTNNANNSTSNNTLLYIAIVVVVLVVVGAVFLRK